MNIYKFRMLALATFLDELPPDRFDYSKWSYKRDRDGFVRDTNTLGECGTVGCALGWATTMPLFRELGMFFEDACPSMPGNKYGINAAMEVFNIEAWEANLCFMPCTYGITMASPKEKASSKEVAAHLRKFAEYRWPTYGGTD